MTDDGRYIVIDGRRWRATDPSIPDGLRQELVRELMAARRAVGSSHNATSERAARARVQDAKVALGERGEPWWEQPSNAGRRRRIAATLRTLARTRGAGSACPSEIAKVVGGSGWRSAMDLVREVGAELADSGELEVRQRGKPLADPLSARGPIRYAAPRTPPVDR